MSNMTCAARDVLTQLFCTGPQPTGYVPSGIGWEDCAARGWVRTWHGWALLTDTGFLACLDDDRVTDAKYAVVYASEQAAKPRGEIAEAMVRSTGAKASMLDAARQRERALGRDPL